MRNSHLNLNASRKAVGNADFQLGDSVTNKTHVGHFTFYFEPIIHEANHVMIARDICFMGYNGGAGCQFFNSWDEIGSTVRDSTGVRPSLLAALAFHHENLDENIKDPISLSGKFADNSILNNLYVQDSGKRHYETAKWYDDNFLKQLRLDMMDDETHQASDSKFYGSSTNFICYQGLSASQGANREFNQYTINTGHLGDKETTDVSLCWSGHLAYKSSVDYRAASNTVSLMSKTT